MPAEIIRNWIDEVQSKRCLFAVSEQNVDELPANPEAEGQNKANFY